MRRLVRSEAAAAARVHRAAFDARLPWLAGLHTAAEDRAFYEKVVFETCEMWGAFDGDDLVGFLALREDWIEQFYVQPACQRRGVGAELLSVAQARRPRLQLWTFQANREARRFYERRGFAAVEFTDGSRNEEREPDMRYVWQGAG